MSTLPADVPAAFCVVIHFPPHATSVLPQILARATPLRTAHAQDGDRIREGHIYVAPPDRHLRVADGRLRLTREARVNRNRPAVDPLMSSAGLWFRDRSIGVVLSGNLDDGTAGLLAIKRFGGVAVVQDPVDAAHKDMPRSAIEHVVVDHVVDASAMGRLIDTLARSAAARWTGPVAPAELPADLGPPDPSGLFSCPDCGGVLQQFDDETFIHFQCRVGHQYSPETLYAAQIEEAEQALWMALRVLAEKAEVAARLARRFRASGDTATAERYERRARETRRQRNALVLVVGPEPTQERERDPVREPVID